MKVCAKVPRLLLIVTSLAWQVAAHGLNGVEVPVNGCTTISGVSTNIAPYYGPAGPAPANWAAAVQLGCVRYAAAHRTCAGGAICTDGTACSSVLQCDLAEPPIATSPIPAAFASGKAYIITRDNLASCPASPSAPHLLATANCGCPAGAQLWTNGKCYCADGRVWSKSSNACILPANCPGSVQDGVCNPGAIVPGKNCPACDKRGAATAGTNPINVGTGMKTERDLLYRSATAFPLSLDFTFLSGTTLAPLPEWTGLFGRNRISSFDRMVRILGTIGNQNRIAVVRPDGKRYEFRKPLSGASYAPDADIADRLENLVNASGGGGGWKFTAADDDSIELYDQLFFEAPLLLVIDRQGRVQKYSYADGSGGIRYAGGTPNLGFSYVAPACSPPPGWLYNVRDNGTSVGNPPAGRLLCVTDHFGRQLHFQYNPQGRITKIADPAGGVYQFLYDGASGGCDPQAFDNPACTVNNLTSLIFPDGAVRTYHYNEASHINDGTACAGTVPFSPGRGHLPSHLTGLQDEKGVRFADWTYDCQGRAISSQHAGGARRITVAYDSPAAGQSTVTDYRADASTANRSRVFGFTTTLGVVRNTSVSVPCDYCGDRAAAFTYDANGNHASRTDWNGNRTNYTQYDLARNLEKSRTEGLTSAGGTTPQTRAITTDWDADFRLPTRVAEPLRITTNVYDADGTACGARGVLCSKTVQATTDADGSQGFSAALAGAPRTWTYTYNANGSVLIVNGPRTDAADATTYTYYANDDADLAKRGNVATITNAAGQVTGITAYNAHGQPLEIVDPNGMTTTLTYDARLRLKSRNAGGELTSYNYDNAGQLTKVTLPDGSFLSYTYDDAHRLTGISDSLGNAISYTLDAMGNRTREEVRDPANNLARTRSRVYNSLNRLFQGLGAQSQTTEYAYDDQGNVLTVKDPLNHTTSNQYDALNRLRQVTDPGLGVTQYAYNGLDALTQVTDPRNLATGYTVDGLGNLTLQSSPDTGSTTNTYDDAGNLLTQTDAKGQLTTYAYDALNRVTLITFQDGSKQTYLYDQGANGIGRLFSIAEVNAAGQTTSRIAYAYDSHGRVTSETRTIGGVQYVTTYAYDGSGRLVGMAYPGGRTVTYTLDALGRISRIDTSKNNQTQTVVSSVAYQPFGGVKSFTFGNGQVYTRTYDQDGRISAYGTNPQWSFQIGYDAASRIESIVDLGTPQYSNSYGYDALDRLTQVIGAAADFAYTYDPVGNRLTKRAGSQTDSYTYSPASNRLGTLTPAAAPPRTFVFDANGSTTADGKNTYTYDVRGRMVSAVGSAGTVDFQVNALGQRVRKRSSLGDTVFHYDTRGHLIAETDPDGASKREYIYLGDMPVGVVQ